MQALHYKNLHVYKHPQGSSRCLVGCLPKQVKLFLVIMPLSIQFLAKLFWFSAWYLKWVKPYHAFKHRTIDILGSGGKSPNILSLNRWIQQVSHFRCFAQGNSLHCLLDSGLEACLEGTRPVMPTGGNRASSVHPGARAVFLSMAEQAVSPVVMQQRYRLLYCAQPHIKRTALYGLSDTIPCAYTEYNTVNFSQASLLPTLASKWMLIEWLNTESPQHVGVEVLLHSSSLWQCKKASLNWSLWP